jgi:multidrug/hemolysin transport system ATP-binding protein
MNDIIVVKNLVKNYGSLKAVKNISFKVKEGEFFALLGTNGAGKTTTINILCNLLTKTEGDVLINGLNIDTNAKEIRESIGVVFQTGVLDNILTVEENIKTRASFYGLESVQVESNLNYLSEKIGINNILKRRYGKLSGGQKRKADIVRALINKPKILFLDEPTTGLDPKTRQKVWSTLNDLRKENNMTIILTTHYMEETNNADYIVVLHDGEVKAQGTPSELKDKYSFDSIKLYYINEHKDEIINYLNKNEIKHYLESDYAYLKVSKELDKIKLINELKNYINSFEVIKGDMDSVFLSVTGENLNDVENVNEN